MCKTVYEEECQTVQESLVVDKIILSDSHFYATWSLFFCNLKWNAKLCREVLQLRKIILSDSQTSNQIWTFLQFDHKLTWSTCCRRDSAKLFKRKSVGLWTGSSLIDGIISRVWSCVRKILSEKTSYLYVGSHALYVQATVCHSSRSDVFHSLRATLFTRHWKKVEIELATILLKTSLCLVNIHLS